MQPLNGVKKNGVFYPIKKRVRTDYKMDFTHQKMEFKPCVSQLPIALDLSKGIPCSVPSDLTVSCSA